MAQVGPASERQGMSEVDAVEAALAKALQLTAEAEGVVTELGRQLEALGGSVLPRTWWSWMRNSPSGAGHKSEPLTPFQVPLR